MPVSGWVSRCVGCETRSCEGVFRAEEVSFGRACFRFSVIMGWVWRGDGGGGWVLVVVELMLGRWSCVCVYKTDYDRVYVCIIVYTVLLYTVCTPMVFYCLIFAWLYLRR
jgi:hypothetical protein